MRILYIHPEGYQQNYSEIVIPIGVIGIVNLLIENNHTVHGINIPLEKKLNKNFSIIDFIKKNNYDIFIIDLHWHIYSYNSINICRLIKSINKNSIIIMGGITASIYCKEILNDYVEIDFLVKGDSEESLLLLINQLINKKLNFKNIPNLVYRDGDEIISTASLSNTAILDKLNYWNLSWLKNNNEFLIHQAHEDIKENGEQFKLAWIPIARGCNYNCSYCGGNRNFFDKIFKYKNMYKRSIASIINDVENLYNKGVNKLGVTHDLSIFPEKYWNDIFKEIIKKNFKVSVAHYCFQLPSNEFIYEFIKVFEHEGSIIGIPVITGNDIIRKKNGKFFTNTELFKILNYFIGTQIKVSLYFIDNAIDCGNNTFDDTLELINKIISKYKNKIRLEISYGFELLQPYSPIYMNKYKKDGYEPTYINFKDIYYRFSKEFEKDIKSTKDITSIIGHTKVDIDILRRYKYFNNLIKNKLY